MSTVAAERSFTVLRGGDEGNRLTLADDAAVYLQHKRKRLTAASQRGYQATLDRLVDHFPPETTIDQFEPPAGTRKLEGFLAEHWSHRTGRTYNKNLSVITDFFGWAVMRGRMVGDPTRPIERAKVRQYHRTTFTDGQHDAILAANPDPHDWLPLKLLLDYGIRRGALQRVRFDDFDHAAQRLVLFTKGETIHRIPIPEDDFWAALAAHIGAVGAQPFHYLLPAQTLKRVRPARARDLEALRAGLVAEIEVAESLAADLGSRQARALVVQLGLSLEWLERTRDQATLKVTRRPTEMMGEHGVRGWWYRCLTAAGVVEKGTTSGERIHKARHSSGQRVLNRTGNLKAVQKLLGHSSIRTTADTYVDWDIEQLEGTMREVLA